MHNDILCPTCGMGIDAHGVRVTCGPNVHEMQEWMCFGIDTSGQFYQTEYISSPAVFTASAQWLAVMYMHVMAAYQRLMGERTRGNGHVKDEGNSPA